MALILPTMKITAVTKFKHGGLWLAMKKLNWSQRDLADQAGLAYAHLNGIVGLRIRPSVQSARKIQLAFECHGVSFDAAAEWPESFRGIPKPFSIEQTEDVSHLELAAAQTFYSQLQLDERSEKEQAVLESLPDLDERERAIVEMSFGINGCEPRTCQQIGEIIRLRPNRVHQIQQQALLRLKKMAAKKMAE